MKRRGDELGPAFSRLSSSFQLHRAAQEVRVLTNALLVTPEYTMVSSLASTFLIRRPFASLLAARSAAASVAEAEAGVHAEGMALTSPSVDERVQLLVAPE